MKRNVFFVLFFILLVTLAAVSLVSCGKPSETTALPNETTTAPMTTDTASSKALPFTQEAVSVGSRYLTDAVSYKTVPSETVIQTEAEYRAYQKDYFLQCYFFEEIKGVYDEDFFESHTLLALYVSLDSGSFRAYLRSVTETASVLSLEVGIRSADDAVTDDVGTMLILAAIPKTEVTSITLSHGEIEYIGMERFQELYPHAYAVGYSGKAIEASGQNGTPRLVTSREALTAALTEMGYGDLPESVFSSYDDSFFENQSLLLVPVTAKTATARYYAAGVLVTDDAVNLKLACHDLENGDDGMREWLLLIAVRIAPAEVQTKSLTVTVWQTEYLSPKIYQEQYAWQDKISDFKEVGKDAALESAAKTPEGAYMTVVTLDASLATGDGMKAFLKEHSFKSHLYGIERDEGLIVYLNESGLERMAKLPEVLKIDILTESDPLSWMRKVEIFYISNQDESTLYDPDNDLIRRLAYTDDGRFRVVATVSEQLSDGEIETLIGNIGLEGTVGMHFFGPAITFLCNNMDDLKTIAACEDVVTIDFVTYIFVTYIENA